MDFATFYKSFHDPLWVTVLSVALFFPVRQMIWVLYVRKKQKSQKLVSEEEKKSLKKELHLPQRFYALFLVTYMSIRFFN